MASKHRSWRGPARGAFIFGALACLLGAGLLGTPNGRSLAQEGTPGATPGTPVAIDFTRIVAQRPVEVQSGACEEPGELLAALTPLEKPEGEASGQPVAIEAERSYTSIPLSLESMLASQTKISVLFDDAEDAVVIACGEIGGVVSEGGTLVVKLSEQHGSGFSGIAFLAPEDAGTTGASIFLAGQLTVEETRELAAVATPSEELTPLPEPTPTAEPLQVANIVLLEWLIDMPTEIRAGPARIVVTNEGAEPHGLVIEGQGVLFELPAPLEPGNATVLSANLPPGEYVVFCPLGDGEHRAEGMESTVTVVP